LRPKTLCQKLPAKTNELITLITRAWQGLPMRSEAKFLLALTIASFVPLGIALVCLRIPLPWAAGLFLCGILTVLVVWRMLRNSISSSSLPHCSAPLTSQEWPQRTVDTDKLVDRLVSTTEELITRIRESTEPPDDANVRQELHERLSCIFEQTSGPSAASEPKEVTVLLSDLRGFTLITENYSAPQVVDLLNRYFTHMCAIIYRHGGTVDKFIGDSIMALFGVHVTRPNDIVQGICCAVEMQIAMDAFNKESEELGMPSLYMGIGINTGAVVAGKIGSDLHSEYTVIGDEVNLASRIEAYTLRGQILISQNTFSRLEDLVIVKEPILVSVKGKREPVLLYELVAIGPPYNLRVPEREARRSLRAEVNIPLKFQICEGKVVCSDTNEGHILNISSGGMFARSSAKVEPYYNIKFKLGLDMLDVKSDDIYGKILSVKNNNGLYEMSVEFTVITPKDRNTIKELVNKIVGGTFVPAR
jgi:adenylate cyclase